MTSKLELNLSKPGDVKQKLQLNLLKTESFLVKLKWAGKTDLDLHALACSGPAGSQPGLTSLEQILSTYNVKRVTDDGPQGTLDKAADGTFSILGGALVHSKDADDGDANTGDDEWIRVNPAKLSHVGGLTYEIPLVAMIHPQTQGATFSEVKDAEVRVEKTSGEVLLEASLSRDFGQFVGVQMGSILIDETGVVTYSPTTSGFPGDFNAVINHFS